MKFDKTKIAIVIPKYKETFSRDERISWAHLDYYLSDFHHIVIKPESLPAQFSKKEIRSFPDHYFVDINSYSKMLLTSRFYETFSDFEFILIYQLDCLAFSADLASWCDKGYDYIGAPLFEKDVQPPRLSRVGNGGLSLRRVRACLDVLQSRRIPSWVEVLTAKWSDLGQLSFTARWRKKISVIRSARLGVEWYARNYSLNEDLFWSDRARLFHPGFRIAPMDDALRFAFDAHPRACFQENGGQLPFGAHAWAKWDRAFWEETIGGLT